MSRPSDAQPAAPVGGGAAGVLDDLRRVDVAVYNAVAQTPTPNLDQAMRHLSNAANYSRLWFFIAAGMSGLGGSSGRRSAATGTAAIGVASVVANLGIKPVAHRRRPDRDGSGSPEVRHARMPDSTSFPSGHSASAFAFATAVSASQPLVGAPLLGLAGAVAYSRVHTGVHYPGDVVAGSILGIGIGSLVAGVSNRLASR